MQNWAGIAVMAMIAAAGVLATLFINSRSNARIEGALGADVANCKTEIRDLKTAKGEMWVKINTAEYDIGRLKLHTKMPRNGD